MFEVPEGPNTATICPAGSAGAIAAAILNNQPTDVAALATQMTDLEIALHRGQEAQRANTIRLNRTRITAEAHALAKKGFAPVLKDKPTREDMTFDVTAA